MRLAGMKIVNVAASPSLTTEQIKLVYVDDSMPGIRRIKSGRGFRYLFASGKAVREKVVIDRILALVIPPAWTDVWICAQDCGHLQVTGRDARGRKQSRYHDHWRQFRDAAKYDKLVEFARALPRIRRSVTSDLRRHGLPREKVLAAIVRLMENALIRIGNVEYARTNHSYGLTTMRDKHAHVHGSRICFDFCGKSGVQHEIELNDARLAKIVSECQSLPRQELFQYLDDEGQVQDVGSTDVNDYLREISGGDFTAKDFRTWGGTSLAAEFLLSFEEFESETSAKRNVVQAIAQVAKRLGNTRAVCRKSYIHPAVIESYLDGSLVAIMPPLSNQLAKTSSRLSRHEKGLVKLLQHSISPRSSSTVTRRQRVIKGRAKLPAVIVHKVPANKGSATRS